MNFRNAEERAYAREKMSELLDGLDEAEVPAMRVMTSDIVNDSFDEDEARQFWTSVHDELETIDAEIAQMRANRGLLGAEFAEADDVPTAPKVMLAPQ